MKKSKKLMILGLSAATAAVAATGAVSSFAWFVLNDEVSATGMVIKAASNQIVLQINNENAWISTADNAYRTVAAATTAETTITATHPVAAWEDGKKAITIGEDGSMTTYADVKDGDADAKPAWVAATSNKEDSAAKDTNKDYTNVSAAANTVTTKDANNGYTLLNKFYLRLKPTTDDTNQPKVEKMTASVNWQSLPTVSSDPLAKSVRVLVWNETDKAGTVYTPTSSADATSLETNWVANSFNLLGSTTAWSAKSSSDYNVRTISVYVYFDGEDKNCFTKNIVITNTYSVNVSFKVADSAA